MLMAPGECIAEGKPPKKEVLFNCAPNPGELKLRSFKSLHGSEGECGQLFGLAVRGM